MHSFLRTYRIAAAVLCAMLFFVPEVWASDEPTEAQKELTVAERNAAQGFNDTIDRLAPDFVTVSLVVAEPGAVLYTVLGHACLRLQCPSFGLDYIFSYESENVRGKVFRFLIDDLKMGITMMAPEDYVQTYIEEGRGVKSYTLNLPPEVKMELWRMCDEGVEQEMHLQYDPVKRGCAISVLHVVEDAVKSVNRQTGKNYAIGYSVWGTKGRRTIREIFYENAAKGWGLFWCMTIVAGRYVDNPHIPTKEKLIAPFELVERWQNATIDGKAIISQQPVELSPSVKKYQGEWFSPFCFSLLILALSLLNLCFGNNYLTYVLLGLYAVFSLFITYMLVFPSLPNTDWNWLIIPFNILPVLFWHWRRYWALPYAIIIMVWCLAMIAEFYWGHVLVYWPHIILALSFFVVLVKQSSMLAQLRCKK